MAVLLYVIPLIFVRREVSKAASSIHQLLVYEHLHLLKSQRIWLNDALEATKENNNALLYMLHEMSLEKGEITYENIWLKLARISEYDPMIGFAQAYLPNEQKTAVIHTFAAKLYPIGQIVEEKNGVTITLVPPKQESTPPTFLGVQLPQDLQIDQGSKLFTLFKKEHASEVPLFEEEVARLPPNWVRKQVFKSNQSIVSDIYRKQSVLEWATKLQMISLLTPLYVSGLPNRSYPDGLARIDSSGNGFALLTDQLFSNTPLFDDVHYYKTHQPAPGASPLANGTFIVTDSTTNLAYVGNTLFEGDVYLSVATPLGFLAKQLALSSGHMVIMWVNKNFWLGFDSDGNKLSTNDISTFANSGFFNQNSGTIEVAGKKWNFNRILALDDEHLIFFDFAPWGEEESIIQTLYTLENSLSNRIVTLLALISLGTIFLVLIFIGRIGYTIIYPITKLANATEDVVAGKYGEVTLPDMGKRQDEVAILTRSFGAMVSGLQEREKIRGVLDKVVSKDVADEILATQIHLGGEDRIVTMLFCDIRGFTSITAQLAPQKTIELLNACMTKVSRVIEGEGGIIDKYVGDEVMAIFGAPTSHPDHALRAVSTGILILETMKKWNQERVAAGLTPIQMGMGIHTGLVVAGNMGAEDRLNYTVLGSNVNLAARLCQAAKPDQLIISEATLGEPNIKESFYYKSLAPITLKGFTGEIQTYEIAGFKWDEI